MAALSLLEALADVPDPRSRHGRIHSLAAILALTVLAMVRGCRGPVAIAQFGRDYGTPLAHALGFTRGKTPAASCLCGLFRRLDAVAFEAALSHWIQARTAALAPPQGGLKPDPEPLSLDGTTLRGSRDGDVPGPHLVAASAPLVEAVLAQVRVDAKTNEHKAALQLLGILPVRGRIVIGDAIFCQREICQAVIDRGGDYVWLVKDNQPGLRIDRAAGFGYEAAQRSIAAACSPRRLAAAAPGRAGRDHDGQGPRAARAADVADDHDPDAAPAMGGAQAGLRANADAHGQGPDHDGSGLQDHELDGAAGRRRTAAGADAGSLGDRE
jgi:hypothetical protein